MQKSRIKQLYEPAPPHINMSSIVPAILPTSRADLDTKLGMLKGIASSVQIDIVDGRFVSPASWPYVKDQQGKDLFSELDPLPYQDQMHYEMDLMVEDPEQVTGIWIESGAQRITVHAESTKYLPKVITDIQVKFGHAKDFAPDLISLGLAINLNTELALIEPYMEHTDYVQLMGIKTIGKQGEPFDSAVLRKVSQLRHKYPEITIQVDGGVSLSTAQLLTAGVDRLIIGSALWKSPDIKAEMEKFQELVQEYGNYS